MAAALLVNAVTTRETTTSLTPLFNPAVQLRTGRRSYTQPLLRNFSIDSNRQTSCS